MDGLSRSATEALHRIEARELWPGWVEQQLAEYRTWLRRPGRWLYVPSDSNEPDELLYFRDELEVALRLLPRPARAELARVIAPLDAQLLRRTMPEPHPLDRGGLFPEEWWHHRLAD